MNISQEMIEYEQARGECFKLFAACYYEPAKNVFLEENLFENLSRLLKHVCPDAFAGSVKMGQAIAEYTSEELLVEYAKLFVGPYELRAAPYGSVYLDSAGKIMGDSTMQVLQCYRDEGLTIDDEFRELPDHIAAELEFMYYLIFKEREALVRSDSAEAVRLIQTQELFLENFLKRWIHPFCDKVKEGTENGFYRALAEGTHLFIDNVHPPEGLTEELQNQIAQV